MRIVLTLMLVLALACPLLAENDNDEPIAPRLDGLGEWHFDVTTESEDAQAFFDQGLRLSYGFNHAEAIRAFKEAARLDPGFAMPYWGQAFALGPNINDKMPHARELEALAAVGESGRAVVPGDGKGARPHRGASHPLHRRRERGPGGHGQGLRRRHAEALEEISERP